MIPGGVEAGKKGAQESIRSLDRKEQRRKKSENGRRSKQK